MAKGDKTPDKYDVYYERAIKQIREEEAAKYIAEGAHQDAPSPFPRPSSADNVKNLGRIRTPDEWKEDALKRAEIERARDAAIGRDRSAERAEEAQARDHHARDDFNRVGEDRRDEPEHENHALQDERGDGAVEQDDRGEQFSENAQDVTERHPIDDYGWSSDPDRDDDRGW